MRARPVLTVLAALAIGGTNAACATSSSSRPVPSNANALRQRSVDDGAAVRSASLDDGALRVVNRELRGDYLVGKEPLVADCNNGVVTLRGQVSNVLAKQRAVTLAQLVDGVRAVVDRVTVAGPSPSDADLDSATAAALSADPATANLPMAAHVHSGIARLTGAVASHATQRIAEHDVLAVPGVVDIVDDLAVEPAKRDDAAITTEVERTLRNDPWLSASAVQVSVRGGVVILTGSVNSAAESARIEGDARESSPDGIDMAALRIVRHPDGTRRAGWAAPNDYELATALREAYARDPRVRPFAPAVEVRAGVAILTGDMASRDAMRAAADDARKVPGMADTHEAMNTAPVTAESDSAVLTEVRAAMDRDPHLARRVIVDVRHGEVLLRGSVATESDRVRAIAVATSVRGVRDVDDSLSVDTPKLVRRSP